MYLVPGPGRGLHYIDSARGWRACENGAHWCRFPTAAPLMQRPVSNDEHLAAARLCVHMLMHACGPVCLFIINRSEQHGADVSLSLGLFAILHGTLGMNRSSCCTCTGSLPLAACLSPSLLLSHRIPQTAKPAGSGRTEHVFCSYSTTRATPWVLLTVVPAGPGLNLQVLETENTST